MALPPQLLPLDLGCLPEQPVSRLAPTPSGFLHLGNALNFLVTWALVRSRNGHLHLRIDDMDAQRFRPEVLEDIFASLEWLGLDWDEGPDGPESFLKDYSLQPRKAVYFDHLRKLGEEANHTFVCQCSRKAIKQASVNGLYPGTCRSAGLTFTPGQNTIRLAVDEGSRIDVGGRQVDLAGAFGDFVLWRRDDQPSYQLASLIEDETTGANLIVRGEDLLASSAAQLYLARCFGFRKFPACTFFHHDLIRGEDGEKLSKSRGAYALKDIRESGRGADVAVREAAKVLGLDPETVNRSEDLLAELR
ncbi:MAG: glutamate--tRNA ligase family protein [Desulfobacterales bacterium]|nr:glutamate--tRNA ligase family protein [Desulfobacterales bacterium]